MVPQRTARRVAFSISEDTEKPACSSSPAPRGEKRRAVISLAEGVQRGEGETGGIPVFLPAGAPAPPGLEEFAPPVSDGKDADVAVHHTAGTADASFVDGAVPACGYWTHASPGTAFFPAGEPGASVVIRWFVEGGFRAHFSEKIDMWAILTDKNIFSVARQTCSAPPLIEFGPSG